MNKDQQCQHCPAIYPAQDQKCPVCTEPSPVWEAQERARLLEEPVIGYEAAWPR